MEGPHSTVLSVKMADALASYIFQFKNLKIVNVTKKS